MSMAGIILAGGKSTRMKQDKAKLLWQGHSLLSWQVQLVEKVIAAEDVYVSGSRVGFNAIEDLEKEKGPLEGLRSVLRKLTHAGRYSSALVVPVDMPRLSIREIRQLQAGAVVGADAVVFTEFQLPVLFTNLEMILERLNQLKDESEKGVGIRYSFKELYRSLSVTELDVTDISSLKNTNTPEEWHEALSTTGSVAGDW